MHLTFWNISLKKTKENKYSSVLRNMQYPTTHYFRKRRGSTCHDVKIPGCLAANKLLQKSVRHSPIVTLLGKPWMDIKQFPWPSTESH